MWSRPFLAISRFTLLFSCFQTLPTLCLPEGQKRPRDLIWFSWGPFQQFLLSHFCLLPSPEFFLSHFVLLPFCSPSDIHIGLLLSNTLLKITNHSKFEPLGKYNKAVVVPFPFSQFPLQRSSPSVPLWSHFQSWHLFPTPQPKRLSWKTSANASVYLGSRWRLFEGGLATRTRPSDCRYIQAIGIYSRERKRITPAFSHFYVILNGDKMIGV